MSSASSTPSIRVYESHRYSLPHHRRPDNPSPAVAMAIPRARDHVPPPLPPPRHIEELRAGQDPGWHWSNRLNSPNGTDFSGNRLTRLPHGSSLYGASASAAPRPRQPSEDHNIKFRGPSPSRSSPEGMSPDNSIDHNSDEDHNGKSRPPLRNPRFTSEQNIQHTLQSSSQAYDKQLLSKIGGPNTPTRTNAPPPASSTPDLIDTHSPLRKPNGQLNPISVPSRLHPSLESPGPKWPPSGAISPVYSDFRSPINSSSTDSHRGRFGSISTPGPLDDTSSQHRGSYDHSIFSDHEFGMEENGMRDLNISDRSPPVEPEEYQLGPKGGLKRRASSPPSEAAREDRPTTSGHTDLYHRRSAQMLGNRNCTASRFQSNTGSLSSASSIGQHTGSIGSSFGFSTAASSMTSYSGDQHLSPNALSPLGEPDSGPVSPYAASRSLDPSPRGSLSRPPQHQRGPSESDHRKMSTESILHPRNNSVVSRIPGAYICECCPKKPKKFDSEEELRLHELEKQYICHYCPNRFKNKNEAERHQNSLHLRRHSWSCAALAGAGVQAAFHQSATRPNMVDICGYCGEEFPNPADWEARAEHLNQVHKFGECNQAKKFFRADHFRQHLKHSHAGTSGKWTNMLENACMREELPPQEQRVGSISSLSGHTGGPLAPKPGVIDEVRDES